MRSTVSAEPYARYDYWRPPGLRWLGAALRAVDALFDRVYTSRANPLYRTGTLAALFLAVAVVTGVYLIFVYEIGRPWESVAAIQRDVWLGRWIRAVHRYASDAAVVAVLLHVVRLVLQGKTWGARALAWVTGVLLTGAMFVSAFTGFVLVWDAFGQKAAVGGARLLRLLPLFAEPPDRAFAGGRAAPSAFFFMNLFLHVAIPLGMVGLLWLHSSKLARAAWFPERKVVWGALAALVALGIAWPAPLPPAADLLAVPGRVPTDWFYAFWMPLVQASPAATLTAFLALAALLVGVPWTARPGPARRAAPAWADPEKCEGCEQCFHDCPYDAIQMAPGKHPERHPLLAVVQPDLCVSCGLCAASCASLAIGPPARTARHQLADARALVAATPGAADVTLVVACRNDGGVAARLRAWAAARPEVRVLEVDCAGTLHPGTASYLAGHVAGVAVVTCPPQNCVHREGAWLADARLLLERPPAVPGRLARQRVTVLHHAGGEWPALVAALEAFRAGAPAGGGRPGAARLVAAVAFTAVLLAGLALASGWPQGVDGEHGVLRLGWQLAGQVREACRDLTPEELARRPVHMRQPRECTATPLAYDLRAAVDGRVLVRRRVRPQGLHGDRPLAVEEDLPVAPGEHLVEVTFAPVDATADVLRLALARRLRFERGRVVLVTDEAGVLVAK
jgi:ferredoxin